MTVSYQYDVASSASGGFIRLLFRWRGSVWKVVYREMLIFTACYITLTILYQFALSESQQRIFERVVYFCATFMDLIPLSFMLGFYVSFIAARWWSQFIAIPWPDKLMNIIAMYIPGFDEDSRVVRRTLMRYLNLSLVLVLRSISMAVKRRFPTKEHLIEAGFMTKTELEMFQSVPSTEFNTFWIPCTWFINVLRAARQECRITDSNGLKLIMEELNEFRSKCGLLWGYDWISIPLVYTQVVTMATYAFYVACMFGRQNVNAITDKAASPEVHRYDFYIPIFTVLQLMFYMGLLKVAEQLINPFGDDDEDFELNWIIDRHMKVSYLGVDTLNSEPPPLVKDTYYNELDVKIPYTEASKSYKKKTYRGSVAYMQVPMEQQGMVLPDMSEEEDDGETVSEMGPRRPSVYTLFNKSKGVSPAGSYTNLDNRSTASVDSVRSWKSSLPNLATAKNASGTLGDFDLQGTETDSMDEWPKYNQAAPFVVDMAKAEDDEIVLQEVIIDRTDVPKPSVQRSDSLQIPGKEGKLKKQPMTAFGLLRGLSPKIAPKFPREKLKSMFSKRRLSSAFPFYKLKGVSFSRDTKDDDKLMNQSLLDVSYNEPVEVEITLSTPELTETEKETGVHPYYYTQQPIISAKQLATDRAFTIRQPIPARSDSGEKNSNVYKMGSYIPRSSSLPNITHADEYARYVHDPIIESSLKRISEAKKNKEKIKEKEKTKVKRKSPPPRPIQVDDSSDDAEDSESPSDTESSSRRNTLPQITLTRCEQKAPEHLDLATSSSNSGHSRDRHSDFETKESSLQKEKAQQKSKQPSQSSQQNVTQMPKTEKIESAPEPHSTSKKPRMPSPQKATTVEAEPSREDTRKPQIRKKSPPPKRPEKLNFAKTPPATHIAGISLKSAKAPSSPIESAPTSPVSAIPSGSKVGRTLSFPKSQKTVRTSSVSPKHSPTSENPEAPIQVPRVHADTAITISDSTEDLTQPVDPPRPPAPPQRHIPRTTSKGKK